MNKKKKMKPSNVVYKRYSVTFNDNTETLATERCTTSASPMILNEYEGPKGQEVLTNCYNITAKPAEQDENLTKEKLLKLYEEFKNKKRAEHGERVTIYKCGMMEMLRYELIYWGSTSVDKIKKEDFEKAYSDILANQPKYIEPTLDEFMTSMKPVNVITWKRYGSLGGSCSAFNYSGPMTMSSDDHEK